MRNYILMILFAILLQSCIENKAIDTEKPKINVMFADAFPKNCDTLYFGETNTINIMFSDNIELGSYTINIHHNFDHHSHSTEVTTCELSEIKQAVNPFLQIQDYDIPKGLQAYTSTIQIDLPASNSNGIYDDGDYHFFIGVTDKEGWSTQKGLNIKIVHRN